MASPLPAYDKLKDIASHGFLVGAFFPWVFVLLVDGTIYELFIPDGVSLVDRFLALDENDQLYAAIALVIGLAGLAAASDLAADEVTTWYRRQSWRRLGLGRQDPRGHGGSGRDAQGIGIQGSHGRGNDVQGDDGWENGGRENGGRESDRIVDWLRTLDFHQRYAWLESQLDEKAATVLLPRIDSALNAIKRSAIFIIGFGLSIVVNTIEFLRFQPDHMLSGYVLLALWLFTVGPLALIRRQFNRLLSYDRLIFSLIADDSIPNPESETAVR